MNYVVGFLFDKEIEEVVLIRKTHPEWQAGLLNGVGGKIEEGESPLEAMVREFEEEAGKYHEEWEEFCHLSYENGVDIWFFVGTEIKNVETQTDEEIEIRKVENVSELETVSNLNWMVPMAKNCIANNSMFRVRKKF